MSRAQRVVVTGANGQVGLDLIDTLAGVRPPGASATFEPDGRLVDSREFEVLALSHHELDITDDESVRRSFTNVRPDVVVNLAAYTAVDRAESDEANCFAVNASATGFLSQACQSVGAHFITISTDYVFDGEKGAGYVEDDAKMCIRDSEAYIPRCTGDACGRCVSTRDLVPPKLPMSASSSC